LRIESVAREQPGAEHRQGGATVEATIANARANREFLERLTLNQR
jgi:hypothetical protein